MISTARPCQFTDDCSKCVIRNKCISATRTTYQTIVPHYEIEDLSSAKRVNKLLNIVKENKIVILEGRLKKEEETDLIEITMEEIDGQFKGIELSVIYPDKEKFSGLKKVRQGFVNVLLGDRQGMTIVGPASVVKKIEQNPDKIELFTQDTRKSSKRRKNKR